MESVAPASFGVQVYKDPDLSCVLTDGLEPKVLDKHRGKTLLMFYFHWIKHTSVRINSDEEFLCRSEISQSLSRIAQNFRRCRLLKTHPHLGQSNWYGKIPPLGGQCARKCGLQNNPFELEVSLLVVSQFGSCQKMLRRCSLPAQEFPVCLQLLFHFPILTGFGAWPF